ncbi:hypothetical protein R3P38DRAFT_3230885 [Favolaschia claudopus]|uniref:Uncharacterized protein n=1 Tax=Favolaschia claudopus TaxID=2862362 RepID=A0AAV9ZLZ9_9AGAR
MLPVGLIPSLPGCANLLRCRERIIVVQNCGRASAPGFFPFLPLSSPFALWMWWFCRSPWDSPLKSLSAARCVVRNVKYYRQGRHDASRPHRQRGQRLLDRHALLQSQTVELLSLIYHDIDIAPPVYLSPNYVNPFDHTRPPSTSRSEKSPPDLDTPLAPPTQLALIYLIFNLGARVELNLPAYNAEAEHYFDLASAAMSGGFAVPRRARRGRGAVRGWSACRRWVCLLVGMRMAGEGYSMAAAWEMVLLAAQLRRRCIFSGSCI